MKPLAIDLYCGLGGWTEGLLAEGYRVVGFDNERHRYPERITAEGSGVKAPGERVTLGDSRQRGQSRGGSFNYTNECAWREQEATGRWSEYPAQLVLQDVLTLHGAQFKDAALIVASPPCQAYSYRAMPWKRAKALPPPSNELFDACFRIQREACEAARHHVPLVVENVCGAQKWVGRARWHYGSFYLWGDVPALMPITKRAKVGGFRFDGSGKSFQTASVEGWRSSSGEPFNSEFHQTCDHCGTPGMSDSEGWLMPTTNGPVYCVQCAEQLASEWKATKNDGGSWFNVAQNTTSGHGQNPDGRKVAKDGLGGYGGGFGWDDSPLRRGSSKSTARKAASAHIAKIPFALAQHIAQAWKP